MSKTETILEINSKTESNDTNNKSNNINLEKSITNRKELQFRIVKLKNEENKLNNTSLSANTHNNINNISFESMSNEYNGNTNNGHYEENDNLIKNNSPQHSNINVSVPVNADQRSMSTILTENNINSNEENPFMSNKMKKYKSQHLKENNIFLKVIGLITFIIYCIVFYSIWAKR